MSHETSCTEFIYTIYIYIPYDRVEFVTTDILSNSAVVSILYTKPNCANRPQQKLQLEALQKTDRRPTYNRINDSSNCAHRIIYFKLFELRRGFYLLFRPYYYMRAIGMSFWIYSLSLSLSLPLSKRLRENQL